MGRNRPEGTEAVGRAVEGRPVKPLLTPPYWGMVEGPGALEPVEGVFTFIRAPTAEGGRADFGREVVYTEEDAGLDNLLCTT